MALNSDEEMSLKLFVGQAQWTIRSSTYDKLIKMMDHLHDPSSEFKLSGEQILACLALAFDMGREYQRDLHDPPDD